MAAMAESGDNSFRWMELAERMAERRRPFPLEQVKPCKTIGSQGWDLVNQSVNINISQHSLGPIRAPKPPMWHPEGTPISMDVAPTRHSDIDGFG